MDCKSIIFAASLRIYMEMDFRAGVWQECFRLGAAFTAILRAFTATWGTPALAYARPSLLRLCRVHSRQTRPQNYLNFPLPTRYRYAIKRCSNYSIPPGCGWQNW